MSALLVSRMVGCCGCCCFSGPADPDDDDEEGVVSEANEGAADSGDLPLTTPLLTGHHSGNEEDGESEQPPPVPTEAPVPTNRNVLNRPAKKPPKKLGDASQRWEDMFAALERYIRLREEEDPALVVADEEEKKVAWRWDGRVRVGTTTTSTGAPNHHSTSNHKSLGHWVDRQRLAQRRGRLKPERAERLNSIGLQWDPK